MTGHDMSAAPVAGQAIPDYIPPHLVHDFDLFGGPLFEGDLHDGIARLAEQRQDIIYTPLNGGHWVVLGRDAIFEAATDTETFSNSAKYRVGIDAEETTMLPIGLDPPEHGVYRRIFNEIFSAAAMAKHIPEVKRSAGELIDAVKDQGHCDFAKSVAEPLPVLFFMRLMGFPTERFAEFREWVLSGISQPDPAKRQLVWDKVNAMSADVIRSRQASPQSDLVTRLLNTDIDGRKPTFDEMQSFCLMLFIAGLDTVTNAMSLLIRRIAKDQSLQQTLRDDLVKITAATEEMMRRYTANTVPRFVTRDTTFRGAPLKKGDFVMLFLPAGDLDPRAFADPEKLDLERRAPHLAFGAGPHRCVGAQLARVEMKAMIEEWLQRIPPFRLDEDKPWKYHTGFVFSIDSLPLRWD